LLLLAALLTLWAVVLLATWRSDGQRPDGAAPAASAPAKASSSRSPEGHPETSRSGSAVRR
jgi:hypothetical protein